MISRCTRNTRNPILYVRYGGDQEDCVCDIDNSTVKTPNGNTDMENGLPVGGNFILVDLRKFTVPAVAGTLKIKGVSGPAALISNDGVL